MPLVPFEELPNDARLWTFAASRPLSESEARPFLSATDAFLTAWTAHKVPLATASEWRYGQFLFVAVNENVAGASGCSIDALVHYMRDAEKKLGVRLTDNGLVWFRDAGGVVQAVARSEFQVLADRGEVGADTIVFDNTIITAGALREGKWEIPASRSWHNRAFTLRQVPPLPYGRGGRGRGAKGEPPMPDKTIRTERLELVDQQGRTRAVLSCEDDTGIPSCTFLDAEGETRVIVGLSWNDVPSIQLCAPDGTARVALVVRPEGMGMVILADNQKQTKTLTPDS